MKEYKYIKISDESAKTDKRLEEFVDSLRRYERGLLYEVTQHGGGLVLVWNDHIPARWENTKEYDFHGSEGFDHWTIENHVQDPPKFSESLETCLATVSRMQSDENARIDENQRATINADNLNVLESLGFVELERIIDTKRWDFSRQNRLTIPFIMYPTITDAGLRYLEANK